MSAHPLLALALASTALACSATPERRYAESPLAPPEHFAAGRPPAGEPPSRWWETFGDPSLAAAVDEALAANRDLAAAAARLEAAAAEARAARGARLPTLDLSGSGRRTRQNFVGFPIPGGGDVLSTTSTSYGVSLDLAWEPDLWGRLAAGAAAADAELVASAADLAGARLSLAGQVAKSWVALAEARLQLDLSARTVETYRRNLEVVRERHRAGLAEALDVRLLESQLAGVEALQEARNETLERITRQLEVLLGRNPDGLVAGASDLPPLPPPVPAGLPAALAARRPDLAAAEARVAALDLRLAEARAALRPSLRLSASGGRVSDRLSDLLDANFDTWSLAGSLFQPLFQGGRLRAAVDAADARTRAALEAYAQAWLRALGEVETALAAEGRLAERERRAAEAAAAAREARAIAEERYRTGLVDVLFLLETQRGEIEAESAHLSARAALLENRIDLHLALGGGFETADDDPSETR